MITNKMEIVYRSLFKQQANFVFDILEYRGEDVGHLLGTVLHSIIGFGPLPPTAYQALPQHFAENASR